MNLLRELRIALRSLRRTPGFFAFSTLLLATGIGSTLYVFSAIDGFVLRPMPFPDPDRLVALRTVDPDDPGDDDDLAARDLFELRDGLPGLEALAGHYEGTVNLGGLDLPERVQGGFVAGPLLDLLGATPTLGRSLAAEDETPGAARVTVLSDELWRHRFESDPAIVGRIVRLNGEPTTIVGVAPPGFEYPLRTDLWLPLRAPASGDYSEVPDLDVVARLEPGARPAAVRAALDAGFERLARERGDETTARALVLPLAGQFVGDETRRTLALMMISVVLVLLIGCFDVANLLLVRGLSRRREAAVRSAMGASRRRLVVAGLVEAGLVATVASALGLAGAHWAGRWTMDRLHAAEGMDIAPWIDLPMDARAVAAAIGVALLATLAAALGPALAGSRPAVLEELRHAGRGAVGGRLGGASRTLVVAQIALSVALVTCAVLSVRSVQALARVPVGVDGDRILGARVGLFEATYPDEAARLAFFRRAERELAAEPGVVAATVTTSLPATLASWTPVEVEGGGPTGERTRRANVGWVATGYFDAVGQRLDAGRAFETRGGDTAAAPEAVVNRLFVERFLGGETPLGRRIRLAPPTEAPSEWVRVVGVVPDVDHEDLDDGLEPMVYLPLEREIPRFAFLVVRTAGPAARFAPRLREIVASIDSDQPVYWLRTVDEWVQISTYNTRFLAGLFSGFALAGLLLAGAGLYGVLAFTVERRTAEIGLRRALGAGDPSLVGWIARGNFVDLAIGLGVGGAIAALMARPLASLFYGVSAADPAAWLAMPLVLAVATTLAGLVPTLRALSIEPAAALREE